MRSQTYDVGLVPLLKVLHLKEIRCTRFIFKSVKKKHKEKTLSPTQCALKIHKSVGEQQTCSFESCQSMLSEMVEPWLEGESQCVVNAVQTLRSTLNSLLSPSIFHESSPHKPAGQWCPHWPLWSVAKWRLPLPNQTQHLLFARQLAFFPASRGQGSSWFRMFCAFFRAVMDASRPWAPFEAGPERGIKQISLFFFRKGDGWV